ncbi:zinc finger, CCHC-type containing protein [Tanacetum coccineum]|uniref:Zinc finger, CCHC-type containing protein n=1 Tax=Tanacetum coccineum TaxID=301880 RepID=A0ABQ5DJJ5_9ASTR
MFLFHYLLQDNYRRNVLVCQISKSVLSSIGGRVSEPAFQISSDILDILMYWLFRFYVIEPNESVSINSIIESKDAIFVESRFSLVPRPSLSIPKGTEYIGGSVVPEEVTNEMDVKTDFLNGELDEEVYMNQPQDFIMSGNENKSHYIEKVLKTFNYFDCTSVSTPIDTSEKLMPNNGQLGKLSKYTSNPSTQHWQAIQRVLKYLKKTMDYSLTYTDYPSILERYTDASWISNTEDNSSTSAKAAAGKEAEWLRNLILKIPLWSKPIAPISILYDSSATLAKAYSQMYNGKSRHLGVRHSMIRELITHGVVSIEFVSSQQNLADHLTKGLARDLVLKSVEGICLKSN